MIIQKFLPIFISGLLLCGCASGAVNSSSEMETLYTEVSKAETEDFVSTIDKENCFLCGSNRPGIFDYYKKSGCIALVCPYGIITTNRKSPVYQGFSVIWQGFSSFSKPKNRAAK